MNVHLKSHVLFVKSKFIKNRRVPFGRQHIFGTASGAGSDSISRGLLPPQPRVMGVGIGRVLEPPAVRPHATSPPTVRARSDDPAPTAETRWQRPRRKSSVPARCQCSASTNSVELLTCAAAALIIASELSMPVTKDACNRAPRSVVSRPSPHPRSTTRGRGTS